jgi:hypothetical protein
LYRRLVIRGHHSLVSFNLLPSIVTSCVETCQGGTTVAPHNILQCPAVAPHTEVQCSKLMCDNTNFR